MEVNELREKLHTLIDNSSEETLKYMYAVLEEAAYSDEFKKALDEEYNAYQKDKTGNTREDVDMLVSTLLTK